MTSQPERPPPQPPAGAHGTRPDSVGAPGLPGLGLIMAVTDLSAESEQALSRAVLLAVQHRAQLRFVYWAGGSSSHHPDPQARLMQRCRALGRRYNIPIEPVDNEGSSLKHVKAAANGVHLLVIHHRLCGKSGGFVRRSVVDQLLHESGCPVLVVKGPVAAPYRNTLVALDLKAGSEQLLKWGLIAGAKSRLSVFHALDNQVMQAGGRATEDTPHPRPSVDEWRATERQRAQTHLRAVVDRHVPASQSADIVVAYGEPVREMVSLQCARQVHLIVMGKRHATFMEDVLQRSPGQRVLNQTSGDVLISPLGATAPSHATAGEQEVAWT